MEIAIKCNVYFQAIIYWMDKYGIKRRNSSEAVKGRKKPPFTKEHREKLSKTSLGWPGYWLEKKRSEATKEKFRLSHLGKKQSRETILKRVKRGSEHYNWQGGITPLTRKRTKGTFWKQIADEIRQRDKNICQSCGFEGNGKKLPVHHKIAFKISKDNSPTNLITLCQSCHMKVEESNFNRDYRQRYSTSL